jgi:drug/metabolite transporter (DMT)-like permease
MTAAALALALGSAVLHAGWNTLVADARDTHATTAVALLAGVLVLAPFAAASWRVQAGVAPYAAASIALELGYFALLATAYAGADLTTVYPVARGAAPVIARVVSVTLLAAPVHPPQAAGVLAVGAGVLLVRGRRPDANVVRSHAGSHASRDAGSDDRPDCGGGSAASGLPLALAIAACIAGYTLVDDRGVRHAAALPYFEIVLGIAAVAYLAAVLAWRGGAAVRAAVGVRSVLAGAGMAVAYALVLFALERAEAAPVAAIRETSVVMATVAVAVLGREHVSRARIAGAAVVVAGVAAIALG